MNSMTGYASRSFELQGYTILVEIKSLNNKFLDIRFRIPSSLGYLEEKLRKILKQYVRRGKVDIFISLTAGEGREFASVKLMIDKYYGIIKRIEEGTNFHFQGSLSEIISIKELLNPYEDIVSPELPEETIEEQFSVTVKLFLKSRAEEGENIKRDLLTYIDTIESSVERIEKDYPSIVDRYRLQLKDKIRELIDDKVDETRLLIEAGIFANKVDISEEISRICGHTKKLRATVEKNGTCGRELDFITQEINREINTIGSKVPDYNVAEEVIAVKTFLEKIKEQVRNIE